MLKNKRFARRRHFRHYFPYVFFSLLFASLSIYLSTNTSGQVAIPLSEIFKVDEKNAEKNIGGKTTGIKEFGERLFIGTNTGLWFADKDGALFRQREVIGGVINLIKFSDQIFVLTNQGLWQMTENSGLNHIREVKEIIDYGVLGNQLYIGTSEGLWIVDKDAKAFYKEIKGNIDYIQKFGDQLFVNNKDNSLIVSKNGQLKSINRINTKIGDTAAVGEKLFIKADKGLIVIDKSGEVSPIKEITEDVLTLSSFGDQLYVSTETKSWIVNKEGDLTQLNEFKERTGNSAAFGDAFFVNVGENSWIIGKGGEIFPIKEIEGRVNFNLKIEDLLFVASDKSGLWIINKNNQPLPINEIKTRVNSIRKFDERFFVNTDNGSWISDKDGKSFSIKDITERVNTFAVSDKHLFIGTDKSFWIVGKDGNEPKKLESINGKVEEIAVVGKYIYVSVSDTFLQTFYRINPQVKIVTELTPDGWAGIASSVMSWFCSNPIPAEKTPANAYYLDESTNNPYGENIPKDFRFAKADGNAVVSDSKFSPQEQFAYPVSLLTNEVHYWVKDKWGNTFEHKKQYFGYPGAFLIGIVILIIPVISIIGCFFLAPTYEICNSAVMKPWVRNALSLGINIGLLLHLPWFRNHILRRYSSTICKSDEFNDLKEGVDYPDEKFKPEDFRKMIENKQVLMVSGASAQEKTLFFKHLTAYYACKSKEWFSEKTFPVYVSLVDYESNSFEGLIYEQLHDFGKISGEFAPLFLERGRLFIFFDGVDNVETERGKIRLAQFIKAFKKKNYICLSVQKQHKEFPKIEEVVLTEFKRQAT